MIERVWETAGELIVFDFIYFRKVFFIAFWYGLGSREICRAFYFPPGTAHCPSLVCWRPRAMGGGRGALTTGEPVRGEELWLEVFITGRAVRVGLVPVAVPCWLGRQVCSRAQANHAAVLFGVNVHSSCRPRVLSALRYVITSGLVGGR